MSVLSRAKRDGPAGGGSAKDHSTGRAATAGSGPGGRITPADIEAQVRQITGQVSDTVERTAEVVKPKMIPIGAAGGAVLVAITYLLGRRRGRRRSTVVEIRRV